MTENRVPHSLALLLTLIPSLLLVFFTQTNMFQTRLRFCLICPPCSKSCSVQHRGKHSPWKKWLCVHFTHFWYKTNTRAQIFRVFPSMAHLTTNSLTHSLISLSQLQNHVFFCFQHRDFSQRSTAKLPP